MFFSMILKLLFYEKLIDTTYKTMKQNTDIVKLNKNELDKASNKWLTDNVILSILYQNY